MRVRQLRRRGGGRLSAFACHADLRAQIDDVGRAHPIASENAAMSAKCGGNSAKSLRASWVPENECAGSVSIRMYGCPIELLPALVARQLHCSQPAGGEALPLQEAAPNPTSSSCIDWVSQNF